MVSIPGGAFTLGSDSGRDDEKPVHAVSLGAFRLGQTPVTVGQFRRFVAETGYRTEAESGNGALAFTGRSWERRRDVDWRRPGFPQGDDHPVTCVSWNDCQRFIAWLNARTGESYRLPTEAEWEFAANGLQGASLDSVAWFEGNAGGATHPVAALRPNAYGVHDLIGNVWEWCEDWYGGYPDSALVNPRGPASGSQRVNRGGCWYGASLDCRTRRGKNTPDDRGNGLGFRLAADDRRTRP